MVRIASFVAMVALVLSGCAEVQVKRLSPTDSTSDGVRFYGSRPYVLVTAEPGEHGVAYKTTVVYLPNMNEQYGVTVRSGLGTADGSVKLQDGWMLTELGATVDSKIPETITAVGGLVTAVAGIASTDNIKTGLYRIEFKDGVADHLEGPLSIKPPSTQP